MDVLHELDTALKAEAYLLQLAWHIRQKVSFSVMSGYVVN